MSSILVGTTSLDSNQNIVVQIVDFQDFVLVFITH